MTDNKTSKDDGDDEPASQSFQVDIVDRISWRQESESQIDETDDIYRQHREEEPGEHEDPDATDPGEDIPERMKLGIPLDHHSQDIGDKQETHDQSQQQRGRAFEGKSLDRADPDIVGAGAGDREKYGEKSEETLQNELIRVIWSEGLRLLQQGVSAA